MGGPGVGGGFLRGVSAPRPFLRPEPLKRLTVVEAVVEDEDLSFPIGQMLREHLLEDLPTGPSLNLLLNVYLALVDVVLLEGGAVGCGLVERGIKSLRRPIYLPEKPDLRHPLVEFLGDLRVRWGSTQLLGELPLCLPDVVTLGLLALGKADGAAFLRQRLEYGLANPSDGVRDELDAPGGIEFWTALNSPTSLRTVAAQDTMASRATKFPAAELSPDGAYFIQAHLPDGAPASCGNVPKGAFDPLGGR